MSKTGWNHPIDESDQWDGFNEPGIEHFSGSPIRHLAREVNQNSLDSHEEESGKPVLVEFRKKIVLTENIPGIEELKETFAYCNNAAENESPKAKAFFKNGLKELNSKKIIALEISDHNTKGIKGPSKNGFPFYAFIKAKGQSKKATDTATGSFGIGKFAPYAVSKLRTVFVSTVFKDDDGEYQQLTQGKSILMSHDDARGRRRQGIGFWGLKEKCQPIEGIDESLQGWLRSEKSKKDLKKSIGTTLTILGFNDEQGWEENLAASIVENFFGSIKSGKLQVQIEDKYTIDSTSIETLFESTDIKSTIEEQKNEPEQFENSFKYLQCLHEDNSVVVASTQNPLLGLCELRIFVGDGMPKKVAFLRNGMFISDSLNVPGLKSFSDFKEFVAVFQCKSEQGIELLRAMEPPRHDDFEPDRLSSKDAQEKGRRALKTVARWIREQLQRHAKDPVSEITKLDELKDFFAEEGNAGEGNGSEEVNPYGSITIKAKPIPQRIARVQVTEEGSTGDGPEGEDGEGGGGADGAGGGDSEGGKGTAKGGAGTATSKPSVGMSNLRAVITSEKTRKVSFTPLTSGMVEITIFEVGADSDYQISVSDSSKGEVKNGRILITVTKNQRESLEITLTEEFTGALKVAGHEI
jgi:hypothetical protein